MAAWTEEQKAERQARYEIIQGKKARGERLDRAEKDFASFHEFEQRVNASIAEEAAKRAAWTDTRTPEQIEAGTQQAIAYEKQSLDSVGLNIAGQQPESQPEIAPLTDADKDMLNAIAETGASIQALAEIEQQLRTSKPVAGEIKALGRQQQFAWRMKGAEEYAKKSPARSRQDADATRAALEQYIERCQNEVTNCANLAAVVPSELLKLAPSVGMKAFAIVDRESHNAIITEQQINELKALLGEL